MYIERKALMEQLEKKKCGIADKRYTEGFNDAILRFRSMVHSASSADVEKVVHGRWVSKAGSYYADTFDESVELCVYVTTTCSVCGVKHPNHRGVYSKTLCAPDDANDGFRFDREKEEALVLDEFMKKYYRWQHYGEYDNFCPNCGATMIKEKHDE